MKQKEFKIKQKVKIDLNYLKKWIKDLKKEDKKEIAEIIKRDGITTIRNKKTGFTLDIKRGCMQENTQYLIDYDWRISNYGGIPLSKVKAI